jgi:hypothetical protein
MNPEFAQCRRLYCIWPAPLSTLPRVKDAQANLQEQVDRYKGQNEDRDGVIDERTRRETLPVTAAQSSCWYVDA